MFGAVTLEDDLITRVFFERSSRLNEINMRMRKVPRQVQYLMNLTGQPAKDLLVCQNVPLEDLTPTCRERPEIDQSLEKQHLRFVLCQGRRVILAVDNIYDGNQERSYESLDSDSIPGLLVVRNPYYLRRASFIRWKMEEMAENSTGPDWRYHPHAIPTRELVHLCHKKLLQTWNPEDLPEKTFYRPTDYGWDMGLSLAYSLGSDTLNCIPVCPSERIAALKQPWKPNGAGRCAVQAARQLACIPLFRYMAGRSNELTELTTGLELPPDATFQQAAASISRLLDGDWFQEAAGRDMLKILGSAMKPGPFLQAAGESVTALFRGFGVITGEGWPDWNARKLLEDCKIFDAPADAPYAKSVQWALSLDEEKDITGSIPFRLLVEPMLFLSTNEEKTKKYER